ncbi:hypothetical protein HPB47_026157 [Ixodes persulcatus]|uniref:Uncharacterized protein n=1 Tax=Ixodes persulcatus TaxID=34615 RepID=A0AC60Q0R5_IXOPE|nr:hypothetical protein HPB47_026157 [Ixodes persulcatus]
MGSLKNDTSKDISEFLKQFLDVFSEYKTSDFWNPEKPERLEVTHRLLTSRGLVDRSLVLQSRNGVALIRPPGHHSHPNEASGFCMFNNVAVAAKYAIREHGLKRILIFDWDIHHGDGTQATFYKDASYVKLPSSELILAALRRPFPA